MICKMQLYWRHKSRIFLSKTEKPISEFWKTQLIFRKPSSQPKTQFKIVSKPIFFTNFFPKITKFWLKSGKIVIFWQNSVQNFRKPSSKNAKTQFPRKVKSE